MIEVSETSNVKCRHKHPSIPFIIPEQDTIGGDKENNKWDSTQEPRTPKNQSYRLWWGAASPILNDTPCGWRVIIKEAISTFSHDSS